MTELERDQFGFHVLFIAVAVAALLLRPAGGAVGPWVLGLVLLYDVGTVAIAAVRGHRRWFATWAFGAVLSVAMVAVAAVLVEGLGVLEFPDDGLPRLGPVTLPMAGLWTIPVVVIVAVADGVTRRRDERAGWNAAVTTAAVVLVGAELALPLVPLWRPVGVTTLGELALYLVPAHLLLGALVLGGARWSRGSRWVAVPATAALVALAYAGAAVVGWLLVERIVVA